MWSKHKHCASGCSCCKKNENLHTERTSSWSSFYEFFQMVHRIEHVIVHLCTNDSSHKAAHQHHFIPSQPKTCLVPRSVITRGHITHNPLWSHCYSYSHTAWLLQINERCFTTYKRMERRSEPLGRRQNSFKLCSSDTRYNQHKALMGKCTSERDGDRRTSIGRLSVCGNTIIRRGITF
jgi:hypothetical protein